MEDSYTDSSCPGTDEERGIIKWREQIHEEPVTADSEEGALHPTSCYDIPIITKYLHRQSWARYVPFLPTFDESMVQCSCTGRKKKNKQIKFCRKVCLQ